MSPPADTPLNSVPLDGISETLVEDAAAREQALRLSHSLQHPPAAVPGYQIHRLLGVGAYGSVWLATQLSTGKTVAIKFYSHRRGLDWTLLNREVEKLAVLYTSRNIVGLIHVGWEADPPFYVMEYLENGSLSQLLQGGSLPVPVALRLGRGVLSALVHAHGSGILHCDIKPGNILLDRHHEARLADFGQSRLSHEPEHALGTMYYMAPEQADLAAIPDARWDVYAFGVVLYQMLTGEVPYRNPANERRLSEITDLGQRLQEYGRMLKGSPPPQAHLRVPGVDRPLVEIVDRCLSIDPALRFPNAQAVVDALDNRTRLLWNRPLLQLGILGPLCLLLGIGTLANYAMSSAVRSAQASLIQRALDSDVIAAKILARSMERELQDRTAELQKVALDTRVGEAVLAEANLPWEQRNRLRGALDQWKELVDADRTAMGRDPDESWFLTDDRGVQIYRHPYSAETIGQNYSFRDYFHGRGEDLPKGQVPADIKPIQVACISNPYSSEDDRIYKIAVTVPIHDPRDQTRVIAVLGRSIRLGTLLEAFKEEIAQQAGDKVERTIALYNGKRTNDDTGPYELKLLDHPWLSSDDATSTTAPLRLTGQTAEKMAHLLEVDQRFVKNHSQTDANELETLDRSEHYRDPAAERDPELYGGDWLAAFAPVRQPQWVAVVQERRAAALLPVQDMEARLNRYLRLGLMVCCVLVGALWYFIYRMLSGNGTRWSPWDRSQSAPIAGPGSDATPGSLNQLV